MHLLFVAAAIGLFQRSLQKVQAESADGGFEEVVFHQTGVQREKTRVNKEKNVEFCYVKTKRCAKLLQSKLYCKVLLNTFT